MLSPAFLSSAQVLSAAEMEKCSGVVWTCGSIGLRGACSLNNAASDRLTMGSCLHGHTFPNWIEKPSKLFWLKSGSETQA